jgi:hypothetical protein
MNSIIKKIIILTLALLVLSFFCVLLFTSPAIWNRLNLTNTSSIGDTIGGITAPLLGIISTIFLYLTLDKQIDSINDQKLKNESDIIFMLINQLDTEFNQIYFTETEKEVKYKIYGHEALTKYSESVFKFYNDQDKRKFSDYYFADHLLLVIRSFKLIEQRIEMSKLSGDLKKMFSDKLHTFYLCKLNDSLFKFTDLFKRVAALNDDYTSEIQEFYSKHTPK